MNKEDLILQKLEEIAVQQQEIVAQLQAQDAAQAARTANLESEVKETRDEANRNQAEIKGELRALDTKLKGIVGALEGRLNTFIANMRERQLDINERRKIGMGSLVAAACAAAASLTLSLINFFK